MFQLPQAKRVRRADLYSPTSSPEPAATDTTLIEERLRAQLAKTYDHETQSPSLQTNAVPSSLADSPTSPTGKEQDGAADAQGFDFRLFSTPNTTRAPTKDDKATTQRIIIRSPTPSLNSTPGFLIPSRPKEYYFADSPSTTRRKEFEHVALTGEDVLKLARVRWPGCTLPWRVLTLCLPPRPSLHPKPNPISPKEQTLHPPHSNPTLKKRPRPNKKRRLTIRQRHSTIAKEEVSKAEREVAEREKRTRKNRERKVKRKMKEKEKGKEGKKLTKEISDAKEFG